MKKSGKVISLFVIIIALGIFFLTNFKVKGIEGEPEKGDLRCPQYLSGNSKITCKENVSGGKVTSVDITYYEPLANGGYIQVTKTVKKTSQLGRLSVQFNVKGKNVPQNLKQEERVNVIVLYDRSQSFSKKDKAEKAIIDFSKKLTNNNDNYYVALITFANTVYTKVPFKNTPFSDSQRFAGGYSSHLEAGLKEAYSMFNNSTLEGRKYIVLFGDGRYYLDYPNETTCTGNGSGGKNNCTTRWRESVHGENSVEAYLRKIRALGVTIYGVHYNGITSGTYGEDSVTTNNSYVADCDGINYPDCDLKYMGKVTSSFIDAKDGSGANDYQNAFSEIFNTIKQEVGDQGETITGNLEDTIGDDFSFIDSSGRKIKFDIDSITEAGYTTPAFDIEIDALAATGWHETNKSFKLTYTNEAGIPVDIPVNYNPELYWLTTGSPEIPSCYDETIPTSIKVTDDEYSYYSKVCYEGYDDKEGYKVKINVANQTVKGTKNFTILQGLGFPTQIDLSTNMKCTYEFKADEYNNTRRYVENTMTSIEQRIPVIDSQISSLDSQISYLNNQINNINNTQLGKDVASLKSEIENLNTQIIDLNKDNENKTKEIEKLEKSADENKDNKIADLKEKIEKNKKKIEEIKKTKEEKEPKLAELTAQFDNEYNSLLSQRSSLQSQRSNLQSEKTYLQKQYASLTVQLNDLKNVLKSYDNRMNNNDDLEDYKQRFIDQEAVMKVDYIDSDADEEIKFVNKEENPEMVTDIDCSQVGYGYVEGKGNTVVNKTCYIKFSKTMVFPNSCLDMQTGEQEKCDAPSNKQLNGGNNYYISNVKENGELKGAELIINIPNAGYRGDLDFKMDRDESGEAAACSFDPIPRGEFMFRQIELGDPFLKSYDPSRGIGINYLNARFNFPKIIHGNTWTSGGTAEYDYLMSKTNIRNIRTDTNEEPSTSYLGRDCYFTSSNLYQCSFTRNKSNIGDNSNYWFTDYRIS